MWILGAQGVLLNRLFIVSQWFLSCFLENKQTKKKVKITSKGVSDSVQPVVQASEGENLLSGLQIESTRVLSFHQTFEGVLQCQGESRDP